MKLTKTDKHKKSIESEEDYDFNFDMSRYEEEDKKLEEITSLRNMIKNKPRQSNFRSKYNSSLAELDALQVIKNSIGEYSIKVSQNTSDINDLWNLYGVMDEYWCRIQDIYGQTILNNIDRLFLICRNSLQKQKANQAIKYKIHNRLLYLRKMLYLITQRSNLGIAVEKNIGSSKSQAKKAIIE